MSSAEIDLHGGGGTDFPRLLLTGPPQCGKTTVVRRVVARFSGRAAGFYTREVRQGGRRVGFEIVTLDGETAWLSHVDFPGPLRVGKYGVDLEGLHRIGLAALNPAPGIDLSHYSEAPLSMVVPLCFTAAMSVFLGLYPETFIQFIRVLGGI